MPERCTEDLPEEFPPPPPPLSFPLKVFTDIELVRKHLKHTHFQLVSSEEEADILWMYNHFKNFK